MPWTEPMQGHRVAWPAQGLMAPGDYAKGPDGAWYAMTPNGHLANLVAHAIVEHEDGTITVSPSILVSVPATDELPHKELWHGFLERGFWRHC